MQEPIELILIKHWASYVAVPMLIVDRSGNLIYFNQPAERILGRSFDQAGEINAKDFEELFEAKDLDGDSIASEDLPTVRSLNNRVPSHGTIRIRALDGDWRTIDVTAIPIIGQGDRHLGVISAFWEVK